MIEQSTKHERKQNIFSEWSSLRSRAYLKFWLTNQIESVYNKEWYRHFETQLTSFLELGPEQWSRNFILFLNAQTSF